MAEGQVSNYKVIAIGGSAGSLEVVLKIIAALPRKTTSVIVTILHRKVAADSILPDLFSSKTTLGVKEVEDKEPIQPGTIYVAPADYHLLVEDDKTFALDSSEKVQYSRPSINVSFESLAYCYGKNLMAVLLSGANSDGAEGLQVVKANGGLTIAQKPSTADVAYMPQQAIDLGVVDKILTVQELAEFIKNHLLP